MVSKMKMLQKTWLCSLLLLCLVGFSSCIKDSDGMGPAPAIDPAQNEYALLPGEEYPVELGVNWDLYGQATRAYGIQRMSIYVYDSKGRILQKHSADKLTNHTLLLKASKYTVLLFNETEDILKDDYQFAHMDSLSKANVCYAGNSMNTALLAAVVKEIEVSPSMLPIEMKPTMLVSESTVTVGANIAVSPYTLNSSKSNASFTGLAKGKMFASDSLIVAKENLVASVAASGEKTVVNQLTTTFMSFGVAKKHEIAMSANLVDSEGVSYPSQEITLGDKLEKNMTAEYVSFVQNFVITPAKLNLPAGKNIQLFGSISPMVSATQKLVWSSSDNAIATVDADGVLTAVATGKAVITAVIDDKTGMQASCVVTVVAADEKPVVVVETVEEVNNTLENLAQAPVEKIAENIPMNIGTEGKTVSVGEVKIPEELTTAGSKSIELYFAAMPVAENNQSITIKESQSTALVDGKSKSEIQVAIPEAKEGQAAPSFAVELPNSTVTLQATGESATFKQVIASTADNTLRVAKNVTIQELVVKRGNVYVSGNIDKVSATGNTIIYVTPGAKIGEVDNQNEKIIVVQVGSNITTTGNGFIWEK